MNMLRKNPIKFIWISAIIFGIITPFIGYFVAFQMFFLLIPFGIILLVSVLLFIINFIRYKKKTFKLRSTKIILLLPVFLFMQLFSTYIVDKTQRLRSEQIINKLENSKNIYPNSLNTTFGIQYSKNKDSNNFEIEYERGFFVREVYSSEHKSWQSYGWND
jgi:hypothetical protein